MLARVCSHKRACTLNWVPAKHKNFSFLLRELWEGCAELNFFASAKRLLT